MARTEKRVKPKEDPVLKLQAQRLLVPDGYDFASHEVPDTLPTLFHGTSQWFEDDIRSEGLIPVKTEADLEKIFACVGLGHIFRKYKADCESPSKVMQDELFRRVYSTFNRHYASSYTIGPEIVRNTLVRMRCNAKESMPDDRKILDTLLDDFGREPRIWRSILQPKSLICKIKAPSHLLDSETTKGYAGGDVGVAFLTETNARNLLVQRVRGAFESIERHLDGEKLTLTEEENVFRYATCTVNQMGTEAALALTLSQKIEVYLRSGYLELLFKRVPAKYLSFETTQTDSQP